MPIQQVREGVPKFPLVFVDVMGGLAPAAHLQVDLVLLKIL
jgi:hypothetical protein